MAYSVWIDGTKLGDTSFEIAHGEGRRAGVFHPSAPGLPLLPGVTAMARALLEAGRMCWEKGIDTEDPNLDIESTTEQIFAMPEGRRIQEAAKVAVRLELQDSRGKLVEWESLLISDLNDIRALGRSGRGSAEEESDCRMGEDPIRYFITAKLRGSHPGGARLTMGEVS